MSNPHIVNSDNLQPIPELPTRVELNGDWTIRQSDLRFLVYGPLTRGTEVLVPAVPQKVVLITPWECMKVIATLGGAIAFFIYVYEWIIEPMFSWPS